MFYVAGLSFGDEGTVREGGGSQTMTKSWLKFSPALSGTVKLDSTPAGLNVPICMGGDPFSLEQSAGLCPDRCHAR